MFLCILRPFRIAVAIAGTRKMEEFLQYLQDRFRFKRTAAVAVAAVSITLFSGSLCVLGVIVASSIAGVPAWRLSLA